MAVDKKSNFIRIAEARTNKIIESIQKNTRIPCEKNNDEPTFREKNKNGELTSSIP